MLDRLHQIRDIGVRLAVDGFGTEYSSLSYLHRFPVDFLKIDHSFVEEVVAGWQRTAFLHTIVRLTQTLSITAVGEGVETNEQLCVLREVGCQFGQGYLFAPPMTSAQFVARLAGCRSVSVVPAVPTAPGSPSVRTAPDVPNAAGAPTVPTVPV